MEATGAWTTAETRAFLTSEEGTVPLRLACHTVDDHLWLLSLWYLFRDDTLLCATSASADVVRYIESNPNVAFEVSVDTPPYFGVRGRGTASVSPDEDKQLLTTLLERYLGGTDSSLANRLLSKDRTEVVVRINPTKLYTWDFSERMTDVVE